MRLLRADADERLRNLSRHHDRAAERKVIRARVQAAHACKALLASARKIPLNPAVRRRELPPDCPRRTP